jgi:hypothetical protein
MPYHISAKIESWATYQLSSVWQLRSEIQLTAPKRRFQPVTPYLWLELTPTYLSPS